MQRFHDFFEQRKLTVDLSIPYKGKYFTITEASTQTGFMACSVTRPCFGKIAVSCGSTWSSA